MQTEVLIVGAGPTGLMMACQLALFGIPFCLIEKNPHQTKESRALGIQARTLEIFEQMNIAQKFTTQGQKATALNYITGNIRRHIEIGDMGEGLSQFPYLLMLEQSKTEAILIDFLKRYKQVVHWSEELLSFTQDEDGAEATVQDASGKKETIHAKYIIGADGAHSVVRHTLNIPLAGATYHQLLFVLDCHVHSPLFVDNEVYLSLSHDTFNAFFPLQHNKWRIVGVVPESLQRKTEITFEDVQKHFSDRVSIPVTLSDPNWISIYHSHHRCVREFQVGRVFLLGDSAHIHSPVGAQGMNTGLQDAYNLAWKLAFVLQGKVKDKLLDTYNEERLPFAKRLVATTDKVFSLVMSKNIFEFIFVRYVMPFILQFVIENNFLKRFVFTTISQIGISYRESSLSQNASFGKFSPSSPHPGDRIPFIKNVVERDLKNTHIVSPTKMKLLLFSSDTTLKEKCITVTTEYGDLIDMQVIQKTPETQSLYQSFGISDEGYYLLRPDMYIALRNSNGDISSLVSYLETFFLKK